MNIDQVLEYVEEQDVKFIRLSFCDVFGKQKNVSILPDELPKAFKEGISIDGSAIDGFMDEKNSDLFLYPDPDTCSILPWRSMEGAVIRMECQIKYPDETPFERDCRYIMKKAIRKAKEKGITFVFGTEFEFYLFKLDENENNTYIPLDQGGYMDVSPEDKGEDVRREICFTLSDMGIQPEASHHEEGPGQNEIDFHYAGALTAADNAMAFKGAVRSIAAQYGLCASFMPKPLSDEYGNGLHVNLSVEKDGRSLFEQEGGVLAPDAQHAMAGILHRIREISLFLNPIPSSYRRLGSFEAPKAVNWSYGSRSQLIRIPACTPGHGRMELRSPDPACNPYLAFALILAAAMEGITEVAPLQSPMAVTEYLPGNLEEAIALAETSEFVREVIPESTLNKYLDEKRKTAARFDADPKAVFQQHLRTI